MLLKKLEIVGFKSFFNKTVLHFEPGVTAVVGPNGCGKSNIFDAMRWVLGEQSVKSLRGSDMQDVIFNGTDNKEPVSMAEVSLTFDNSQKYFSVEYDEVIVTRRLFRSGESEYLLNKTTARLKDILDIFMGTGIGSESYSLIQQGKIDLVLSSKPEERRMVFDEAAGITKYKSQKKEALRRLEDTEQNLLRVNDIITEVKRQISSLERQANKARRYKETFDELKDKEINYACFQKKAILEEKDSIINKLRSLEELQAGLLKTIQQEESAISNRQDEVRALEAEIMSLKDKILNLNNALTNNRSRIDFNKEKIAECIESREYLGGQASQIKNRLEADEEKLNNVRNEYQQIKDNIEKKTKELQEKELNLNNLNSSMRLSLDSIACAKKNIVDLAAQIASTKNSINETTSQKQVFIARQKRLELEHAKVREEKAVAEDNLNSASQELNTLENAFKSLGSSLDESKNRHENELASLAQLNSQIQDLERYLLSLMSQKEFLENLKARYEDINESMNATIYLDKPPSELANGFVIKIKSREEEKKFVGEAKPIDLDAQKITALISETQVKLDVLASEKSQKESAISSLEKVLSAVQDELRSQEITIANKKAVFDKVQEQFNRIKEEEDLILLELSDLVQELTALDARSSQISVALSELEVRNRHEEETITNEQNSISVGSKLKEDTLVSIAQLRTELKGLNDRFVSDESTFKILEDSYNQDKQNLDNIYVQINELQNKEAALNTQIEDVLKANEGLLLDIEAENNNLKEEEAVYRQISSSTSDVVKKIEERRRQLDIYKNDLYELQMHDKDIDFKYASMKERLSQGYKVDLDVLSDTQELVDAQSLLGQIEQLRSRIDSYGTVNLVAIEEYDELKKRYDFLNQQHMDLTASKESIHDAIQKINRTTRKMFVETFEKVRVEFRNYFRLLFNGGDAQLFLIDEQDPLESGIEIICRPPGKKLQNVLLLSGGEKSMAAIALIFAIFKIKPSPFCVLDEIDAALDEANVDRFGRILQEFIATSQFIVITHNKKTIANANVMYGITMEESGVSKIVSVKFAQNKATIEDKAAAAA